MDTGKSDVDRGFSNRRKGLMALISTAIWEVFSGNKVDKLTIVTINHTA